MSVSAKQERVIRRGAPPPSPAAKGAFQTWLADYGASWPRHPLAALGGSDANAGMIRLAAELGCAPMTVEHWYYRRGRPKSAWLYRILELAAGALSFTDIIESTQKPTAALKKKTKRK